MLFVAFPVNAAPTNSNKWDSEQFELDQWTYRSKKDPFSEQVHHIIYRAGSNAGFSLKCESVGKNSIFALFVFGEYIGTVPGGLLLRVDDNKIIPMIFPEIRAHKGRVLYTQDPAPVKKLVQQMVVGDSLYVRHHTNDGRLDAVVDLNGAAEALNWLDEKCGSGYIK